MIPRETFVYFRTKIDITKVLADLATGKVRPAERDLPVEFVQAYAEQVLAIDRAEGANQTRVAIFMRVDAARALKIPEDLLDEPVIIMNLGPGKGLFSLSGDKLKPTDVLADGNHRLTRAYLDNRGTPLKALVFSRAQTRRYEM